MSEPIKSGGTRSPEELARRSFEAFNQGVFDPGLFSPSLVVMPPAHWPEGDVVRGIDAWARQVSRLREARGEAIVRVDELRELDERRVVAHLHYVITSEGGLRFEDPMTAVFTAEEGVITRIEYFRGHLPVDQTAS